MKTVSIEADMIATLNDSTTLTGLVGEFGGGQCRAAAGRRPLATFGGLQAIQRLPQKAEQAPLWLPLHRESLSELTLMGLLVVASAVGIGYGALSLLVQAPNWAGFTAWVGQLIHS